MIAVTIVPDPFVAHMGDFLKADARKQLSEYDPAEVTQVRNRTARRPLRGTQMKENTYATLMVIDRNGQLIPIANEAGITISEAPNDWVIPEGEDNTTSSSRRGYWPYNTNFLLQSVSEERTEKSQIMETFGESYIAFFGEHPRLLSVSGVLLYTEDFDWKTEFWYNYERYLRGTRLAEKGRRVWLYYDDVLQEGYLLGASANQASDNPNAISFGFRMFLTQDRTFTLAGDVEIPPGSWADQYAIREIPALHELLERRMDESGFIGDTLSFIGKARGIGLKKAALDTFGIPTSFGMQEVTSSKLYGAVMNNITLNGGSFQWTPRNKLRSTKRQNWDEFTSDLWEMLRWGKSEAIQDIGGVRGQDAVLGALGLSTSETVSLINAATAAFGSKGEAIEPQTLSYEGLVALNGEAARVEELSSWDEVQGIHDADVATANGLSDTIYATTTVPDIAQPTLPPELINPGHMGQFYALDDTELTDFLEEA